MLLCTKHTSYVWYQRIDDGCPACYITKDHDKEMRSEKKIAKQLRTELKLARYELKEEREKRIALQAETSEYLVKKKQAEDLVRERL